jgi:hypothetical protein
MSIRYPPTPLDYLRYNKDRNFAGLANPCGGGAQKEGLEFCFALAGHYDHYDPQLQRLLAYDIPDAVRVMPSLSQSRRFVRFDHFVADLLGWGTAWW